MSVKKYVIGPLGTNCYLYKDDITGECAVIDPAYPDENLLNDIKYEKVKHIFITHAHIDHFFGAYAVQQQTGALVVAHTLENERLHNPDNNLYSTFNYLYKNEGLYSGEFHPIDIDIEVDNGSVIELGKTVFSVLHTPGHTNGSVSYFTEDEMFSGDMLFYASYGRVDFESGSFADMVDSFRRVCSLDGDYLVYPGHQETTTLKYEREQNPLRQYLFH